MQEDWQTLSSIKTSKVARIAAGVAALKEVLINYAQMHGRFAKKHAASAV
jgi:hypothetical protein